MTENLAFKLLIKEALHDTLFVTQLVLFLCLPAEGRKVADISAGESGNGEPIEAHSPALKAAA